MTESPKPDLVATLTWQGGQRFHATTGSSALLVDGTGTAGPSPVQSLAFALGSCMGIDVVDMLEKGRFPLKSVSCTLKAFRPEAPPRRIIGVDLHFTIEGDVPEDRVARAIELSRNKYCSVWHSLNPDIDFKTSFHVNAA